MITSATDRAARPRISTGRAVRPQISAGRSARPRIPAGRPSLTRIAARLALVGTGALVARGSLRGVRSDHGPPALERKNFRGSMVSLAGGPALTTAATATAALGAADARVALAALSAGLGAGAVGRYDDVAGGRPEQRAAKGFHGHLAALRDGQITSGVVKIFGIGTVATLAAGLLPARRPAGRAGRPPARGARAGRLADLVFGAGVIAGTANLVNLLDLRPGRALKASLLVGVPLLFGESGDLVAGPVGAAVALLPDDLAERTMLGDAGANALGALLGLGLAARTGPAGRAALLAGIAALTAASEKISFTKVIEGTPGLRELDAAGRRPW